MQGADWIGEREGRRGRKQQALRPSCQNRPGRFRHRSRPGAGGAVAAGKGHTVEGSTASEEALSEQHHEGALNTQCPGGPRQEAGGEISFSCRWEIENHAHSGRRHGRAAGCRHILLLGPGLVTWESPLWEKSLGCVHRTCAHFCGYIIHLQMFTDLKTSVHRKQPCTFYKKKIDLNTGEWSEGWGWGENW